MLIKSHSLSKIPEIQYLDQTVDQTESFFMEYQLSKMCLEQGDQQLELFVKLLINNGQMLAFIDYARRQD